jgi:nucleotide-binding universal stress UspA family protein
MISLHAGGGVACALEEVTMRVLIAIDGSPVSEEVLAAAAHLLDSTDEIHVLTVTDPHEVHETVSEGESTVHIETRNLGTADGNVLPSQMVVRTPAETVTQAGQRVHAQHLRELEAFVRRVLPARYTWQAHVVASGEPAEAIIHTASELQVHGIAMGTRGRGGIAHALLGSVAEHVVRHASVPVLIVRQGMHVPRPAAAAAEPAGRPS